MTLPKIGRTSEEVFTLLQERITSKHHFLPEKTFSGYYPTPEIEDLLKEANKLFFWANALSPMSFPSLKKFESEVVAYLIEKMHGDENVVGNMTSGSDENILMALKVARDYCRETKPHIKNPEVIIPRSAHPAFLKAAHYFNIKPQIVSLDNDFLPNLEEIERLINANTILIVGSAPNYALGLIDPIEKMGEIAERNSILFHVDANVGGPSPTPEPSSGQVLPEGKGEKAFFDFRTIGVSSTSMDLYYNMGPKGAGVMIYRDKQLRKHQFFAYTEYPGGLYGSPSLPGSRAGGPIAASWALIKYIEKNEFKETSALTYLLEKRRREIQLLGNPVGNIFAFTCPNVDKVHEKLVEKGWYLEKLSFFNALRIHVSPIHKDSLELFFQDLDIILHEHSN